MDRIENWYNIVLTWTIVGNEKLIARISDALNRLGWYSCVFTFRFLNLLILTKHGFGCYKNCRFFHRLCYGSISHMQRCIPILSCVSQTLRRWLLSMLTCAGNPWYAHVWMRRLFISLISYFSLGASQHYDWVFLLLPDSGHICLYNGLPKTSGSLLYTCL
jgi:hypothetical protein